MKKKYSVPALEKGMRIIELLADSESPLGITDLYERSGLPKSTIFMILNTFEQLKYIQKLEDGKYILTFKIYNIAMISLNKLDIRNVARPIMQKIASDQHFTVHLAILENGKAVYVEKVPGPGFVQFSTKTGQTQFLHNSAVGKALAAYIPQERLLQYLDLHGMPTSTEATMKQQEDFFEFLEGVRKVGYAIENEEGEQGIRCIAAPIYNHEGRVIASLGITAIRSELPANRFDRIGRLLKEKAFLISKQIGYTDDEA